MEWIHLREVWFDISIIPPSSCWWAKNWIGNHPNPSCEKKKMYLPVCLHLLSNNLKFLLSPTPPPQLLSLSCINLFLLCRIYTNQTRNKCIVLYIEHHKHRLHAALLSTPLLKISVISSDSPYKYLLLAVFSSWILIT